MSTATTAPADVPVPHTAWCTEHIASDTLGFCSQPLLDDGICLGIDEDDEHHPLIDLYAPNGTTLTADDARALAVVLTRAANALDCITGAT